MTDVMGIVAQLKLTSKGKLTYGKDDFCEGNLTEAFSKLCVSPYTSRNLQNANNKEFVTSEKPSRKYMNYFSSKDARKTEIPSVPAKDTTKSVEKIVQSKVVDNTSIDTNEPVSNYINPLDSSVMDLRNLNEEYHEQSKQLRQKRMCEYYMSIQQFDLEHVKSIESIERNFIMKQSEEVKQLDEDQNRTSEELAYYQAVKEEREFAASEKLRLAELHRKEIEIKIKKDNALKEEKMKKKRTLASMAEPSLAVLNKVTQLFVEKTKENRCEEFKTIMDKVNREHSELTNIVTQGINANTIEELDIKVQAAKEKLDNLNALQRQSEELLKQLEEKALKEQKNKEAAEKEAADRKIQEQKEKEEVAKTQPVSVITSVTGPSTSGSIPAIENELNISMCVPALAPIESMLRAMLTMCVTKSMFREYLRLSKLVADTEKLYEGLNKSTIKEKKTYKFDLYKVINTSINAVSDESPRHLMDKIGRLTSLLSGKEVVNGGKRVSTQHDPQALLLSKDLIAKKLVLQGPTQVASSHKAAFSIAAVALGIWTQFPDVGRLMMGHFFMKCPYTVPFYIPKSKEISTVDYCKLIGYSVEGSEVESEDKFLKKLSGIIRLYAAIISSDVPAPLANRTHPLGLDHGWSWLVSVLNLEPRPVTATILFDFLEVAGHAMMKRYGKQFRKLLRILCEEVMPKILEVTPKESKAGAMRLKIFLDTCIKEGRMKQPEGYLSKSFYSNSYYR